MPSTWFRLLADGDAEDVAPDLEQPFEHRVKLGVNTPRRLALFALGFVAVMLILTVVISLSAPWDR